MFLVSFEILNTPFFERKITAWDNYIRCNPYLLGLVIILTCHFFLTWYLSYKRDGFKVDLWHVMVFKLFVLPFFLIYPFNGSIYNYISVGDHFFSFHRHIDIALLITTVGYICLYIGRKIASLNTKRSAAEIFFLPLERITERNIKNDISFYSLFIIGNLLILFVIYMQVVNGVLLNPRSYFLKDDNLRPLYNATLAIYPTLLIFSGFRLLSSNNFINRSLFGINFLLSFFLGTRSALLDPLLILIVFLYFKYPILFKLRNIVFIGVTFFLLAFTSMVLRNGQSINKKTDVGSDLLFGNTYSDNRDFGWILSKWNGQHLHGRTYIAGTMSIVPRKFSRFREKWALGIYTSKVIGFDYRSFPGLRPGFFGESFLNFGLMGVVGLGLFAGCVLRKMDMSIKSIFIRSGDPIASYSAFFAWNFLMCLNLSNNFGGLYSMIFTLLLLSAIRNISTIAFKDIQPDTLS